MLAKKTLDIVKSRFNPRAAAGHNLIFQFKFTDDRPYFIEVKDSQYTMAEGSHPNASVSLIMASKTFAQLVNGQLDGFKAFSSGQLHAEGNVTLAPKLREFFSD